MEKLPRQQAQEIALFSNPKNSTTAALNKKVKSDYNKGNELETFTAADDAMSFVEDGHTDEEAEERAVAEFVSEIELRKEHGGPDRYFNHEREESDGKKNEEDDDISQQFSIDDVSDEDEGDGAGSRIAI